MSSLLLYVAAPFIYLGLILGTCTQGDADELYISLFFLVVAGTPVLARLYGTDSRLHLYLAPPLIAATLAFLYWSAGLWWTVNLHHGSACSWRTTLDWGLPAVAEDDYDYPWIAPIFLFYGVLYLYLVGRLGMRLARKAAARSNDSSKMA